MKPHSAFQLNVTWRIALFLYLVIGTYLIAFPTYASATSPTAKGFRIYDADGSSRLELDMTDKADFHIFTLETPNRLVIDIKNARWDNAASALTASKLIKNVRHGIWEEGQLRVVLDLNLHVVSYKAYMLTPSKEHPYRLVVEISSEQKAPLPEAYKEHVLKLPPSYVHPKPAKPVEPLPSVFSVLDGDSTIASATTPEWTPFNSSTVIPIPVRKPSALAILKPLIVIDPGHGGHDPGALGASGSQEKNITLAYGQALRDALEQTGHYRVVMTRTDDNFIKLRDRVQKGRKERGDLFISLHADSHPNKETQGLSVYTLSEKASDKEAEVLASVANKEDIISGVNLADESGEIADILIDLVQRDTKNMSSLFAEQVAAQLGQGVKLLPNTHRFAGFRVLTAADIPSVLIELGYLSNLEEENLLKSNEYKSKLVNALVNAIDKHFEVQLALLQ